VTSWDLRWGLPYSAKTPQGAAIVIFTLYSSGHWSGERPDLR
jgi:hypothetical protein